MGEKIASGLIEERGGEQAKILALCGELGSGKTTFVRGLAKGFGLPHRILSPTFIVMREYPLNLNNFSRLYHLDLYRVENAADLAGLGISEIFQNPRNLVVVEWAEKLGSLLPNNRLEIRFKHIDARRRNIIIQELKLMTLAL